MLSMLATQGVTAYHARQARLTSVARVVIEIDPHGKTPSYRQLADQLRARIERGDYQPRQPIPSLKQLQQETALAMGTIQRAVQILEDEGVVYTVPGRGTFVSPRD